MQIAGFIKQSFIDFPGKIASVIFTQGCNFRCPFCHNPQLVLPSLFNALLDEEEVLSYLEKNKLLLDALVISGGEPLMQKDIIPFLRKVRAFNILIKIDTNGSFPAVLEEIIQQKLVDYIAMDIKHTLTIEAYTIATGNVTHEVFDSVQQSIQLIMQSAIDYEFRTTMVQGIHKLEEVKIIADQLSGAKKWVLQNYRKGDNLDSMKQMDTFDTNELMTVVDKYSSERLPIIYQCRLVNK